MGVAMPARPNRDFTGNGPAHLRVPLPHRTLDLFNRLLGAGNRNEVLKGPAIFQVHIGVPIEIERGLARR